MITAIVLAAGMSRRMGRQKLLLPCGEFTLLEHVIGEIMNAGIDSCLVVTGPDHDRLKPLIESKGAQAVFNPHSINGGMLSSVRCGLLNADPNTDGYLICLGDMPSLNSSVIEEMLLKINQVKPLVMVPVFNGKRGHPLYFRTRFKEEIMTQYDEVGLRGFLSAHSDQVSELECSSEGILIDLDTPADYEQWSKTGGHSN